MKKLYAALILLFISNAAFSQGPPYLPGYEACASLSFQPEYREVEQCRSEQFKKYGTPFCQEVIQNYSQQFMALNCAYLMQCQRMVWVAMMEGFSPEKALLQVNQSCPAPR